MEFIEKLGKPSYLLLGIAAAITAVHFTLLEQKGDQNLISVSLLIWLTAASLLWDKHQENAFVIESDFPSTLLGIILMAIGLLRSISISGYHFFLCPVLLGAGLVLITSGFKGFQIYKKELLVFSLFLLYPVLLKVLAMSRLDIFTSMLSTFMLSIAGFEASRDGTFISLPTGKVEVLYSCAGVDILSLMVICSLLLFFIVPLTNIQKILCVFLAPLIGFVINGIRVCLLTFFVSTASDEAFEYWHGEDGSLAFAMISVVVFGLFCWFFYVRPLSLEHQE